MHHRKRHIQSVLAKRAKLFPVVGLLGSRQVGKSTFLTQQWRQYLSAAYLTFDRQEIVVRAKQSPEQFLLDESEHRKKPVIIDEAQKVPAIFDSIKALVDEKRRMGSFTLSGSTDFSIKAGVRESLAGRMGISYLYPMTLRELNNQNFVSPWVDLKFSNKTPLKPKSIETWLARGGMPSFCGIADEDERIMSIHAWLEAICYKDLKQLGVAHGEVALQLLKILAENPGVTSLNKLALDLHLSRHSITQIIDALASVFLLYKLPSLENPRAYSLYQIFDAGVIYALLEGREGANFSLRHARLMALLVNEVYAQYEYAGKLRPQLYHYRTRGGAEIDLVFKAKDKLIAIECCVGINISAYRQRCMRSFLAKYPQAIGYFVAPVQEGYQIDKNMFVVPWNQIG